MRSSQALVLAMAVLWLAACAPPAPTATPTPEASATQPPTATATASLTPSPTSTPTITLTPSETPTPSATLSPTPEFSWGVVNVAQASCRYGPGGAYLLRDTVYEGDVVNVLGHMQLNENWWYIEQVERSHKRKCWVSQELISLGVDRSLVYPIDNPHLVLPYTSQPYDPLKGVSARRTGNIVTVQWEPFDWLPGDQHSQDKYLVEAWVCQGGVYLFRAYGTSRTSLEIQDDAGCDQPSRARAFGSDKHGYTGWVGVPWPP